MSESSTRPVGKSPKAPIRRKAKKVGYPGYRKHKSSGQAIVTLADGPGRRRDVLLGEHGTEKSHAEYDRVIAEWLKNGRRLTRRKSADIDEGSGITVNRLLIRFLQKHETDGRPATWLDEYKYAFRPLKELYGHTDAATFNALALEVVRDRMIESGLVRKSVNERVYFIRNAFSFGVARELVPPAALQKLEALESLRGGLTAAPESEPVRPVADEFVDAIRPYVSRHVWGLIEFQRYTGCRPGEACQVRMCDIDRAGDVWEYKPARHKTASLGKSRVICLGPKAQALVRRFLTPCLEDYLFSPRRSNEERMAELRKNRKSPVQPSQLDRGKRRPKRVPGERYSARSYCRAIGRACKVADLAERAKAVEAATAAGVDAPDKNRVFVPHWHPHQIRHSVGTDVRKQFGAEAAQVTLGHATLSATEIYAERNLILAQKVAAQVG